MPTDAVWVVVTIPQKKFELKFKPVNLEDFDANNNNEDTQTDDNNDLENSMESILIETLQYLNINDAVWMSSQNGRYYHVYFNIELVNNDHVIQFLKNRGIGTRCNSSIGYIPYGLFYYNEDDPMDYNSNYFKEVKSNFLNSVSSRLTVAQVVEGVRSGSELTFDFWVYLFCSSTIAAIAILTNQSVDIAASMMIEPLMGCVISVSFGFAIWDKTLIWCGLKGLFWGLVFCLIYGFIFGSIFELWRLAWIQPDQGVWPTDEMMGRGMYRTLIYGVVIALSGGSILAVTLLTNNVMATTGVAVATTFMPPFINSGLCFALSVRLQVDSIYQDYRWYNISGVPSLVKPAWVAMDGYNVQYSDDMRIECAILACISIAYTFINVSCLGLSGYIVLKMKQVIPLQKISSAEHKFFNEDLKLYQAYQKKHQGKENFGQTIYEEWANIIGIDKNKLADKTPEAKLTQLQTLYEIAAEIENDPNYQRITKNAYGHKYQPQLRRRLTQPTLQSLNDTQQDGVAFDGLNVSNVESQFHRNSVLRQSSLSNRSTFSNPGAFGLPIRNRRS